MSIGTITISQKEYQALLRRQRIIPMADLSAAEKRDLARARREMKQGDFVALDDLKNELGGKYCR